MEKIKKMTLKRETLLRLQERPVRGGFLADELPIGSPVTSNCLKVCPATQCFHGVDSSPTTY